MIYVNLVETWIRCPPLAFYELVATPDNWPRYHPVTRGVAGPTARPAGEGTVFHEQLPGMEATWRVTHAQPGARWEIASVRFGELPVAMAIAYALSAARDGVQVTRSMKTVVHEGHALSREDAIRFSLPDVHARFLDIVKRALERSM